MDRSASVRLQSLNQLPRQKQVRYNECPAAAAGDGTPTIEPVWRHRGDMPAAARCNQAARQTSAASNTKILNVAMPRTRHWLLRLEHRRKSRAALLPSASATPDRPSPFHSMRTDTRHPCLPRLEMFRYCRPSVPKGSVDPSLIRS